MKKIYFIGILLFSLVISCKDSDNKQEESSTIEEDITNKKISSRDVSITSENAYNSLFIDSLIVAAYLDSNDLGNKLERRFLSFYNSRNYQYAWFANDGLTEQARGFYNLYLFNLKHNNDSLTKDLKLQARMENLFAEENMQVSEGNKNVITTELKLTQLFIEHGLKMYEDGYVKRKEMERFIPSRKVDHSG